jgi:hypothetical protein
MLSAVVEPVAIDLKLVVEQLLRNIPMIEEAGE